MTRTPQDPTAIWVWAVPHENGRVPDWLLQLASICAGREVSPEGEFRGADDALARIGDLKRELAALPDSAPYVEWGRWFLSDSPTRSIAPGFTITPAEAKKLREEMESAAAQSTVPVTAPTR
jgi:hypothetical protein